MATSVGEIGLDLVINQKQYNQQLKGITSMAKKAGVALVAAFSVKKIIDFGKDCLELGSNLQEVQNVVDVTFPRMTAEVDEFAKNAAASFGLSETMAKRFTGTFGAMAKAFGFSEQAAYEMGSTLAGLAGDVASFYNISQDEAYTKLKSVFTGETETLKDLGIVMTQNALDAYAMANGYGKVTAQMSEAEKVALRYAFVQQQLTAAAGDFTRTSDSWANQVRILSLQFDSLKATIGQGLINLITPIIKVVNTVIGKLMTLANAFKAFTELITGKKSAGAQISGAGEAAKQSLGGAAGAADNLSKATTGAGKAAKKAAKEMKALMGFDQINKLADPGEGDTGGSGGGGGGGSAGVGGETVDFGNLEQGETVVEKMDGALSNLIGRVKKLAGLFKKGFCIGFGDSEKNIKRILSSIENIKNSLVDIFTAKKVIGAAGKWADAVALNTGKVIGAVANVGISIITNLTAGIAKSLDEKKDFIKDKLASLFTIGADGWNITGDFVSALGDIISSSLTSNAAIDITADVCSMLITGVLGGAELFAQAGLDLTSFLLQPIIDNKGKISEAITNTLGPISTNLGVLKQAVEDLFSAIKSAYDEHVAPTLNTLKKGFSDSLGKLLDAYNEYVTPVLQNLADKFKEVYEQNLKPCFGKLGELIGKVAGAVEELYLTWLKPFIDWCIGTLVPILAPVFETLGDIILTVFGGIGDIVGGLIDIFSGVIDFLTGLFTGNWEQAWSGIKQIFGVFADALKSIWQGIKDFFGGILEGIKQIFSPIGDWFSSKFQSAKAGVQNAFSSIGNWFRDRYNDITNAIGNIPSWFSSKFQEAWNNITSIFSGVGSFFSGIYNTVTSLFSRVGSAIGSAVSGAFKSAMNSAFSLVENAINTFIRGINGVIGIINNIPGVKLGKVSTVHIPRLAQGGYVKPNTPQLAMIGDNRHQGEVVAPEDKLLEMAQKAAQMSGGGNEYSLAILSVLREILSILKELDMNIVIDGKKLKDIIVDKINQHTKTTGVCELII